MTKRFRNFFLDFEPQELKVSGNSIYITDFIDPDFGTGQGLLIDAISGFEDDAEINIVINSPGGLVSEGIALANLIKSRPRTNTIISGIAASIASVMAVSGEKVSIYDNSMLMIHKPTSLVMGDAVDLRKEADILDNIQENVLVPSYGRTALSGKQLRDMIDDETWINAKDAKKFNFVDNIISTKKDSQPENRVYSNNYYWNKRKQAIRARYA